MSDKCIMVVGDVHGDLNQLLYPLFAFIEHPGKYEKIIYLGDYLDKGESNLYINGIINFIMSIPEYADKIIFLRGNHEAFNDKLPDYHCLRDSCYHSFVYNSINKLNFDIIHYDERINTVFSHSPISRPLKDVLLMNFYKHEDYENGLNTYTFERENTYMEYRNIHGHVHNVSTKSEFDGFFKTKTTKMLSIDNDSSYGINLYNNLKNDELSKNTLKSDVYYIIICPNDEYKIVKNHIPFYDYHNNYNLYTFNELKNLLSNYPNFKKYIHMFNFIDLLDIFVNEFTEWFKVIPTKNNMIKLIHDNYINTPNSNMVYFNDTPIDVYHSFGLFENEKYNDIGKIFWVYVLEKPKIWIKNYTNGYECDEKTYKITLKGSNKFTNSFNYAKLFIFLCLLMVVITIIVLIVESVFTLIINQHESYQIK